MKVRDLMRKLSKVDGNCDICFELDSHILGGEPETFEVAFNKTYTDHEKNFCINLLDV